MQFLTELRQAIEDEEVAAIIHAGDWSVHKQDQFYRTMKMFREYIDPRIPILCVRGNHDFWDYADGYKVRAQRQFGELMRMHKEWFKELNIHHLESGPHVVDDVIVCGFDGWYSNGKPPTNDEERMIKTVEGCPTMIYQSSRAYKELDRVLAEDTSKYAKSICVTHFPPFGGDRKSGDVGSIDYTLYCANTKYLQPIVEKFDVLCVGHSHLHVDRVKGKCRLLNCGSDYNKPKFLIFEL